MFPVTCPGAFLVGTVPGPAEHSVSMFSALDAPNALRDPHITLDVETKIRCNVPPHDIYGICTRPT
jgi:hypothetical protein